jgi:YidC/Oxa1 family membrane protein insertase
MKLLFFEILYRPIFNAVVFLCTIIPGGDFGIAVILITIIIRAILFPLTVRMVRSQQALSALGPKINELKEKYKNDKTAQTEATMRLYKEHQINPLSGCLPIFIQLPILIALYRVFLAVSKSEGFSALYPFVKNPVIINSMFLGFLNLAQPSKVLAVLAGIFQFIQAKVSAQKGQQQGIAASMNTQMLYFFPVMIIVISWSLPAGLTLYWVAATALGICEQLYIKRKYKISATAGPIIQNSNKK